jgi:chromosome partitioning protein
MPISWFIKDIAKYELADVLKERCTYQDALVKIKDNFYILPTFGIDGGLKDFAETTLFREPFIFQDLNAALREWGAELVVYDLSPGMSQLERSILSSVDEVLTPLNPEFFSLDGIEIFISELDKINKSYKREIKFDKIVCNNLNKSFSRHNVIYKKFEDMNYKLFTVPQDSKIPESQIMHESIFTYYPESKSIPEIQRIVDCVEV